MLFEHTVTRVKRVHHKILQPIFLRQNPHQVQFWILWEIDRRSWHRPDVNIPLVFCRSWTKSNLLLLSGRLYSRRYFPTPFVPTVGPKGSFIGPTLLPPSGVSKHEKEAIWRLWILGCWLVEAPCVMAAEAGQFSLVSPPPQHLENRKSSAPATCRAHCLLHCTQIYIFATCSMMLFTRLTRRTLLGNKSVQLWMAPDEL